MKSNYNKYSGNNFEIWESKIISDFSNESQCHLNNSTWRHQNFLPVINLFTINKLDLECTIFLLGVQCNGSDGRI